MNLTQNRFFSNLIVRITNSSTPRNGTLSFYFIFFKVFGFLDFLSFLMHTWIPNYFREARGSSLLEFLAVLHVGRCHEFEGFGWHLLHIPWFPAEDTRGFCAHKGVGIYLRVTLK